MHDALYNHCKSNGNSNNNSMDSDSNIDSADDEDVKYNTDASNANTKLILTIINRNDIVNDSKIVITMSIIVVVVEIVITPINMLMLAMIIGSIMTVTTKVSKMLS